MNIVAVCGMGMGSSLILKMNIDEIVEKNGVKAEVDACDLGSISGKQIDLLVTTNELKSQIEGNGYNAVYVTNVIDKKAIEKVVMDAIKNLK